MSVYDNINRKAAGKMQPCPTCGGEQFAPCAADASLTIPGTKMTTQPQQMEASLTVPGISRTTQPPQMEPMVIHAVAIVCTNCGCLRFYEVGLANSK